MSVSHIDTISEILNYASALVLVFLVGTNLAFILRADELFHPRTTKFWRLFFTGKTIISTVLVDVLLQYPSPFTWRLAVIDVGAIISLVALAVIFKDRSYREAIEATEIQRKENGH